MTIVIGSPRSAAVHSAWNEYIAEPSPKRPITRRFPAGTPERGALLDSERGALLDSASAMPTAAGRLCPRPPLAHVKKLCGLSIGICACIVLRLDGDSS